MSERENILSKLNAARQEIIDRLPDAESHKDKELFPGWTLKEMLAHMTGWDDANIASLRAHILENEPDTPARCGINKYNAITVPRRADMDYRQVRLEWEQTRAVMVDIIRGMPEERFLQAFTLPWGEKGTVTYMLKVFIHHEHSHATDIKEWLKDPSHPLTGRH